jgi:hypothetical protein
VGLLAVDAAVAAAPSNELEYQAVRDSGDSQTGDEDGKNPVRDEVSRKVAVAFASIFTDANPRLIPVLNHQLVHLKLLQWDKLQQKLEAVEVQFFQDHRISNYFCCTELDCAAGCNASHYPDNNDAIHPNFRVQHSRHELILHIQSE